MQSNISVRKKQMIPQEAGNIQDNINILDENYIYSFVKLYTHDRPGDAGSNPIHYSKKRVEMGRKM